MSIQSIKHFGFSTNILVYFVEPRCHLLHPCLQCVFLETFFDSEANWRSVSHTYTSRHNQLNSWPLSAHQLRESFQESFKQWLFMAGSLLIYSLVLASPPTHCRDRSASQPGDTLQFNQPPDGHREEYCRRNNGMYRLKKEQILARGKTISSGQNRGEKKLSGETSANKKKNMRRPRII